MYRYISLRIYSQRNFSTKFPKIIQENKNKILHCLEYNRIYKRKIPLLIINVRIKNRIIHELIKISSHNSNPIVEREREKKMEILFTSAVTGCIFFSRRGGHVQLAISRPEKSSKDLYLMKNMVMHAALYSIPRSPSLFLLRIRMG